MPVAGGGFEQCYNAQAAVAAGSLLVVAVDVVQAPNDKQQLAPMLGKIGTLPQGCSTLFTEGHRKYGFETAESGGVAVLRDGVGLIEPENIVGEASNSREDARIFSNARCIFA